MSTINYIVGDATKPQRSIVGVDFIVHCCNDRGAWGAGFVMALSNKWPHVEEHYRKWFADPGMKMKLGDIQFVEVEKPCLVVCNMIGQHDTRPDAEGFSPVRYDAFFRGLTRLQRYTSQIKTPSAVHMPRMGAGLAGGDWNIIEAIVKSTLVEKGIPVTVYDFPVGS